MLRRIEPVGGFRWSGPTRTWPRQWVSKPRVFTVSVRAENVDSNDPNNNKSDKNAILERIAKAKEYKKASVESKSEGEGSAYMFESMEKYASQQASTERIDFLKAKEEVEARKSSSNTQAKVGNQQEAGVELPRKAPREVGTSNEAAAWLRPNAMQEKGSDRIDTNMRAEEFTLEKERRRREQKVVIERARGTIKGTQRTMPIDDYGIAQQFDEAEMSLAKDRESFKSSMSIDEEKDKTEAPEGEEENLHKPKVSTWGVYPRPQNISKTFGGGRNIRPGQELESKEAAAERDQRVSAALANYRKVAGIDIAPEVEQRATELYEQGKELFSEGKISASLEIFSEVADMVPLKSRIGGLANFDKAVCLDSLGRNEEAYPIYRSLKGHTAPGVSKNSQRMLFGFKAAKELKVDTMSYSVGNVDAWRGYFDKATEGTWAAYQASMTENEEDKELEKTAATAATAIMLIPLVLVSVLALSQ